MMILRKHNNGQWTWIVTDAQGEIAQIKLLTSLAATPSLEKSCRLVVLLPGETVMITRVKLPKARRAELEKAVPYALEEQLAEDIGRLHFVLGNFDETGNLTVAVMNKALFEQDLELLKQHGLQPSVIMPDFIAIKHEEKKWTIAAEQRMLILRSGDSCGFAAEPELFAKLLALHFQENEKPIGIDLYLQHNDHTAISLPHDIKITQQGKHFVDALDIQQLQDSPPINLLPRKFCKDEKKQQNKRSWRTAAIAGLAFFIFFFAGKCFEILWLQHQQRDLQQRIAKIYQQVYPKAKHVVAPRLHFQKTLLALQQSIHGNSFLFILEKTARVLQRFPEITLSAINFQNNQLSLHIVSPKLIVLENFSKEINQQELSAKQIQLQIGRQQVSAVYQIRRKYN